MCCKRAFQPFLCSVFKLLVPSPEWLPTDNIFKLLITQYATEETYLMAGTAWSCTEIDQAGASWSRWGSTPLSTVHAALSWVLWNLVWRLYWSILCIPLPATSPKADRSPNLYNIHTVQSCIVDFLKGKGEEEFKKGYGRRQTRNYKCKAKQDKAFTFCYGIQSLLSGAEWSPFSMKDWFHSAWSNSNHLTCIL